MFIKSLSIKGFRNLSPLKLSFESEVGVHAFIGANGQGKTNILEAIYLCCLSKSFRSRVTSDLVGFNEDFLSIRCQTEKNELEVIITAKPVQKALKINGVKKQARDFVGQLKVVFFSPDDLSHMSFSPKLRRRYLDVLLSQLDMRYLDELMAYQTATTQRNSLLKMIRDGRAKKQELDFWDEKLATLGTSITRSREALLGQLEDMVNRHYRAISTSEDNLKIIYQSEGRGATSNELLELYQKSHARDIATGQTHLGPHRDDLEFLLNDHDMAQFSSRGEWRSLVLALKFAEIDLIKEKTGEHPILLLDDVFSELDAERQKYLFHAAGQSQTFITTTHKEFIEALPASHRVYWVEGGKVKSEIV